MVADRIDLTSTASRRRCHLGAADFRSVALPLPHPGLTLSEINADYRHDLRELEDGGAIVVYSDGRQALLGVLTRDPELFGDARLAQQSEAGQLPPLEELLEGAADPPAA
jgi:hypothetical protein